MRLAMNPTELRLTLARAELERAKARSERLLELVADGSAHLAEYDEAATRVYELRELVRQLEARLERRRSA